ncbi:MAG TPA: transposase [Polyangiaceae bacterium]
MHVTLRVRKDAEGLRQKRTFRAIRAALAAGRERFGFRVVQYSVQGNHIHLIAEANDRVALTRGLQGLTIRVALAVNKTRARKGRVFCDRYHARTLKTPLEVRHALLYVLRNDRHHLAQRTKQSLPPWSFDPCSSAGEFDGWRDSELLRLARQSRRPNRDGALRSTAEPRSFLLRVGWRRHGLLGLEAAPGASSVAREGFARRGRQSA